MHSIQIGMKVGHMKKKKFLKVIQTQFENNGLFLEIKVFQ